MNKDIVKCAVKCLAKLKIENTTNSIARDIVIEEYEESVKEIERLNNIINETRRILGEYRHFSTPTEEQNSENEDIVDKAYIKLHSNLQELKGDSSNE